jgi:hypothetical protein
MIDLAIRHLATQLNQFLKSTLSTDDEIVVVSGLIGLDGHPVAEVNNKVAMFLCGIERDTMPLRAGDSGMGNRLVQGAPLFLNLYIVVAANFKGSHYLDALKFISATIGFFQRQPVFDRVSTPDLDTRIERLILDMENLKPQEANNMWSLIGAKYIPSVLYRVRMVAIDGATVQGRLPVIGDPAVGVSRAQHG